MRVRNSSALRRDESRIYWVTDQDQTNVYWTRPGSTPAGGAVAYCPKARCTQAQVRSLALGQERPGALAVDATHVYWANKGTSPWRVEKP